MKFELIIKNAINNSPIEKESQSELLIFENERISCPYLELSTKKKEKKTNSSRSTKLRINFIFVLITASKSLDYHNSIFLFMLKISRWRSWVAITQIEMWSLSFLTRNFQLESREITSWIKDRKIEFSCSFDPKREPQIGNWDT